MEIMTQAEYEKKLKALDTKKKAKKKDNVQRVSFWSSLLVFGLFASYAFFVLYYNLN